MEHVVVTVVVVVGLGDGAVSLLTLSVPFFLFVALLPFLAK